MKTFPEIQGLGTAQRVRGAVIATAVPVALGTTTGRTVNIVQVASVIVPEAATVEVAQGVAQAPEVAMVTAQEADPAIEKSNMVWADVR